MKSPTKIAALGIGVNIQNMIGFSFITGINGAISTLAANSAGAKDYKLCKVYLRRGQLLVFIIFIPILILMLFSE